MTPARMLLQEAQDPRTSPYRLEKIYSEAGENNFRCGDPNIVTYRAAAEAVARHPNVSPDLLESLARVFPKAVLSNPSLPGVLRENPQWAQDLYSGAVLPLLRFENVPTRLLSAFAGRFNGFDLLAQSVRLHIGVTGEAGLNWEEEGRQALWDLMQHVFWCASFPVRLLTLDLVPNWLLEPLAVHYDAEVRRAVARHPRTPPDILTLLRRAGSTSDLSGLAPPDLSLPASALERLARGGPWAQRLAARHPGTPPDALKQLAAATTASVWGDQHWVKKMVQRSLLRNPGTPASVREELAQAAASAAEQRESRWKEDREWRQNRPFDDDPRKRMDCTDQKIWEELQPLNTPDDCRRAARNPNTSPAALRVIASYCDAAPRVRQAVGRNPNTPSVTLVRLAQDAEPCVRLAVALNAAAEKSPLDLLAEDPVRRVRLAVARHPQAPFHVLEWLADDDDEEVRRLAACRVQSLPSQPVLPCGDPAARMRALEEAAGEAKPLTRCVVLSCPDASPETLASGAADDYWFYRLAVARNPAALLLPLAMPGIEASLEALAQDGNRFVRAAAREALQKTDGA